MNIETDVEIRTQNRIQMKERIEIQKAVTVLLVVTIDGKSEISFPKTSVHISKVKFVNLLLFNLTLL